MACSGYTPTTITTPTVDHGLTTLTPSPLSNTATAMMTSTPTMIATSTGTAIANGEGTPPKAGEVVDGITVGYEQSVSGEYKGIPVNVNILTDESVMTYPSMTVTSIGLKYFKNSQGRLHSRRCCTPFCTPSIVRGNGMIRPRRAHGRMRASVAG